MEIRKQNIVFISFAGRQVSDSPFYIYEHIRAKYPGQYRMYWIVREPEKHGPRIDGAEAIKPGSLRFYFLMLCSKYIVTNDRDWSFIPGRDGQVFVNTWHGGGLFKKTYPRSAEKKLLNYIKWLNYRDSMRTTVYLSSSKEWTKRVVRETFGYDGRVLATGLPRNSDLFRSADPELRATLKIPQEEGVILYAPTYRAGNARQYEQLNVQRCVEIFERKEGRKFHFLFRGHHNAGEVVHGHDVLDVSLHPNMQDLLALCDVFITDFSSCLWDFSLTLRPSFIFAPDIEDFDRENGFESDYKAWPFPLAPSNEQLLFNIENFDLLEYQHKINGYHESLGSFECPEATEHAVHEILGL